MAQGERPLRHSRQPSRASTLAKSVETDSNKRPTPTAGSVRDAATISFIRSTLCPKSNVSTTAGDAPAASDDEASVQDLLPPLTSSSAIDIQLYAIIAVVLAQFVQRWYNRITPDGDFVHEIVQIIAHCTQELEDRLTRVDLEALLLDELPDVLTAHVHAIKVAREASCVSNGAEVDKNYARTVYHTLRPHSGLSPPPTDPVTTLTQSENEVDWCQLLVSHLMTLLPPEDLLNPCLNVMVREIFSELIVHNAILGKACEPWLLWEGLTKIICVVRPRPDTRKGVDHPSANRLQQFGLLSSAETGMQDTRRPQQGTVDVMVVAFWSALQYAALAYMLLRTFVTALMHASSVPARPRRARVGTAPQPAKHAEDAVVDPIAVNPTTRPIVSMRLWGCVERLITLQQRMPWLCGSLSLLQWFSLRGPGQVCSTNSALDRLMSAYLHEKVLKAAIVPPLLQAVRNAVFPDNALAPPRVPPTSDETLRIKRECARTIVGAIPAPVRIHFFATQDVKCMEDDVESLLDLFSDPYLNKHLIVSVLELLVLRLFPELGEPTATP